VKYSIVIPTHRRAGLLTATLDSLSEQTIADFEVVVVSDGADQDTIELSRTYSAAFDLSWILLPDTRGAATARNTGVSKARGKIILFLDDDTLPARDWVEQHATHHDGGQGANIVVTGKITESYERVPASKTEAFLRARRDAILTRMGAADASESDYGLYAVCGVNCSISRRAFSSCGGFDEALREVNEDLELGARLDKAGARFIHEPRAVVYHRSTKQLEKYFAQSSRCAGEADAYRVYAKGQRCAQTRSITLLHHGKPTRRLKHVLAWNHPEKVLAFAKICRMGTELTYSEFFFKRWMNSVSAARYWEGVQSQAVSAEELARRIGRPLPVLAFHSISSADNADDIRCVEPRRFRQFMRWLNRRKFASVTPAQLRNAPASARDVWLTFDDGYEDFYINVFPDIGTWRIKPTVFLVAGRLGETNNWDRAQGPHPRKLLSKTQICEMQRHGVEFGSHSLTHAWLPGLSDAELRREVTDSKSRLEDLLGAPVTSFAYPSGGIDARVRSAVAAAGYEVAVTAKPGLSFWQDPLSLDRIELRKRDRVLDFAHKVRRGRSWVRETHYRLFQFGYGATRRLPGALALGIRKSAQRLKISNPGAY
jgi:GT2 family glycosyltransferase/peptidoglycan/xylan/chitin deacetylase (PgdA/CDA1 family)